MFNIKKHIRRGVLALGLAAASFAASASVLPTYQIRFADTASADIAYIDFVFGSLDGAAAATATLSNFSGGALTELDRTGDVGGTAAPFVIGNAGTYNDLFFAVDGPFGFDLNFSEGFLGFDSAFASNSLFSIALLDSAFDYIGSPEGVLQFSLSNTGVAITPPPALLSLTAVAATAVPEPADWALMLVGLFGAVCMTRRNGSASARHLAAA